MNNPTNIKALILPELFPDFEGDMKGVFIEDYLLAVHSKIDTQTLYVRLRGEQKGCVSELYKNKFKLTRVVVCNRNLPKWTKPLLYLKWFWKGYQYGITFKSTNIIHAHGLVLNGLLAYFISKKLNIPFVVTEHTGPFSRISQHPILSKIARFVGKKADKVLVVSEHQKQEVLKLNIPENKIIVTYNPVNDIVFKPKPENILFNKIAFVSRLDEFKGGLRTLKAFHQLLSTHPDYELKIVGEGEEKVAIENYIEENQLQNKVKMKGLLTKAEIAKTLKTVDFLVFPSCHETFGLVVAESLCCGVPVVCTNQTAPKEFVNETNGILVNPDDINAIYEGMLQMIKNYNKYNSSNISEETSKKFGITTFGNKLTAIYQELCAE